MFTYVGAIWGFCQLHYEKGDIEMRQKGAKRGIFTAYRGRTPIYTMEKVNISPIIASHPYSYSG
jgi:hypothetical protein